MSAVLDARGLNCPLPVLKARKALKSVDMGARLTVLATDPASYIDFQHFCSVEGHTLVEWTEVDGTFTYLIEKSG